NPVQLEFWRWLSDYYCCTLGEIMNAALPANLKLSSETRVVASPLFSEDFSGLDDKEYLIAEALSIQDELSLEDVRGILDQKTVYPLIRRLLDKKLIYLKEDLKERYKPKTVSCVRLQEPYRSDRGKMEEAFEKASRSTRQVEAIMAYVQLSRQQDHVRRRDIYEAAGVDSQVVRALEKKGIFEIYDREVSRLPGYEDEIEPRQELSAQQEQAMREIREELEDKDVVLLHGVTGSGKTRLYVEMISEALKRSEQVLYLLPEIALTAQLVGRLRRIFGEDIAVYHSRLNNNERVELWNRVLEGKPVLIGARSALFLPFSRLKLVVIDEEHDQSFKQMDPAPRYNGRDAAIYLAHLHGAKVILGTATPSVESYHNARKGKYGLVEMRERFGGLKMPELEVADARKEALRQEMRSHFTTALLDQMKHTMERGEQVILFQNRRGYAPTYECSNCGWHAECVHCDVSLTYHKHSEKLKCHYCGYQTNLPAGCPACGDRQLKLQGFGTEKIEDELKIYLPEARIGRMDYDTMRTKHAHAEIIKKFEDRKLDILVGTQMVTKGLDFEKVGLVGVVSADQLLHFPDFRAGERAFQLMTQVSGRAGRKHRQGKVIIQAYNTEHPVLKEVLEGDYQAFYRREVEERQEFKYPPFARLIKITLKHRKPLRLNDGARIYGGFLKKQLGDSVLGPAMPYVSRIRGYYLLDFLIKLPPDMRKIRYAKKMVLAATDHLHAAEGFSGVRVNVDVDPYW
ncbi:MAG: primosomal protein N', partial [Saprospiraceae bacterium]|nr:primosomal protein N' [Saprospiraceae bacterium]